MKTFKRIMAGVCLVLFASIAFAQITSIKQHTHSSASTGGGTLAPSGPVTSTKPCATGYTRINPNFCLKDIVTPVALTRDVCTTIASPSPEAVALLMTFELTAVTANVVAFRFSSVQVFDSGTCVTVVSNVATVGVREFIATVAATAAQTNNNSILKVFGGNVFMRFIDDGGNGGAVTYSFVGYFD